MIYYFLPEPTIHGGIKVGFQFSAMLRLLGIDVVIATPNGSAPSWFPSEVTVVRRERVLPKLTSKDKVIFSLPQDYTLLKDADASLILHCQGTDEAVVPIVLDENVEILTCWKQAEEFSSGLGRQSVNVGISISRSFFYSGERKQAGSYALMPRRGTLLFADKLKRFEEIRINNSNESKVSELLKRASGFLSLSEDEWFGLPALEAMAAGCLVVSPRTVGGGEYLDDGANCFIESLDLLSDRMSRVLENEALYSKLRFRGMETAARYHPRSQYRHLTEVFESGALKFLR